MTATGTAVRRFEYVGGTSRKFWEVWRMDRTLLFRWGRIGTFGQDLAKQYQSVFAAERELDKLVDQKRAKGYREVKRDVPVDAAVRAHLDEGARAGGGAGADGGAGFAETFLTSPGRRKLRLGE